MSLTKTELTDRLTLPQFPKSSSYDAEWIIEHSGGPHVLWLAEALSQTMDLKPGMRILDMGCGRAISSIFLAKEFGAQVWATDLWVSATDNWDRILDAGADDAVFPIHAEAHSLPFADGFFDAAFSVDAYHYFGTDDLFIERYSRLVKPDGQIGMIVPGLTREFVAVPDELAPHWAWDFCSFHSPDWWRHHWEKTGKVRVELADLVPDGAAAWLRWCETCEAYEGADPGEETALVKHDAGRWLGLTRVVARMTSPPVMTALQRAVGAGAAAAVADLLSEGADPNARNRAGSTSLHHAIWACSQGQIGEDRLLALIEILLSAGADVNARHPRLGTARRLTRIYELPRAERAIADGGGEDQP